MQIFSLAATLSAGETVDFVSDTGASAGNLSIGLAAVVTTNKEQSQLSLTVDGGSAAPIGQARAVSFTLGRLESVDAGAVTFADAKGKSVKVAVAYGQNNYTANLSSLTLGAVTDSLAVGQYDFVNFTKTNDIQTHLISQFPTGLFEANDDFATPFDITSDANGNNFNDSDQTITINVGLYDVTSAYTLMNAYGPPGGGTDATVEFIGSGGVTETFMLINGQQIRDFHQGF